MRGRARGRLGNAKAGAPGANGNGESSRASGFSADAWSAIRSINLSTDHGARDLRLGACVWGVQLWACNHYTLFDYTVLHLVSRRPLRAVVKADIARDMPVLGPFAARFLFGW